jgi:hypothetical protein
MKQNLTRRAALAALLFALIAPCAAQGQKQRADASQAEGRAREVAARFAPVFRQALGDSRRGDLITNFDFDGDWRGDNNWAHAADTRYRLRAYVYYAASETETHFFVHYAVFHPRDYKGGAGRGPLLSEIIREGAKAGGKYDPTGLSSEAVLAHENDMEGCLVVAAKRAGSDDPARAEVVYVETLSHDRFLKYATRETSAGDFKTVRLEAGRPILYVEPKGHGVVAYDGGDKQSGSDALLYRYAARADDPEATGASGEVGYELLPLLTTLWPRARGGANQTYGESSDFAEVSVEAATGKSGKTQTRKMKLGKTGTAFLGTVGAPNAARPPWGWFDRDERDARPGAWFFDPAATVKSHFRPAEEFSLTYVYAPFLGINLR